MSGRAAQKRRLALLTLLAVSPGRSMTRDKVVAMLWPEKELEQARHLLSVAVYEIRKELGEPLLESRGDDLVLDDSTLRADVWAFDQAIRERDLERAVSLHAGPFLDGVHLGGSAELDQWVDRERDSRERDLRAALETLAEEREAAGDGPGAVEAWRRLAAEDRYDSRIALRLLRALDATGNMAGALQFARIHAALLREEFGTEPSPAFLAAVSELGAARAPEEAGGKPPGHAPEPVEPVSRPADQVSRPVEPVSPPEELSYTDDDGAPASPPQPAAVAAPRGPPARWEGGTGQIGGVVVVILLIALGLVAGRFLFMEEPDQEHTGIAIAVLPFTPIPAEEDDLAFADGLTEEVMDVLGSVEGVRVSARSASFAFRGTDGREVARQLGVDYVLGGSVRRGGDRLRIRAELSGADGFKEWSDQWDRPTGDIFATWEAIAVAVLGALQVELEGDGVPAADGGTTDLAALDAYMKGRYHWFKRTADGFRHAQRYLEEAVRLDPRYARAHTGLADVYNLLGAYDYGVLPPDSAYPRARAAADRAIELAPRLAEAYAARAQTRFAYERDWDGAEADYRKAISLNPRYAEAHHWYALFLIARGRPAEAIAEAREALALDSFSLVMRSSMGRQLYFRGDHAGALRHYRRVLELDPTFAVAHHGLGLALLQLDRADEAVASFRKALDVLGGRVPPTLGLLGHALARAGHPDEATRLLTELRDMQRAGNYVAPEYTALILLALGDQEGAIDQVEAAFLANSSSAAFLEVEPLVAPLRGHPRFDSLRARVRPR